MEALLAAVPCGPKDWTSKPSWSPRNITPVMAPTSRAVTASMIRSKVFQASPRRFLSHEVAYLTALTHWLQLIRRIITDGRNPLSAVPKSGGKYARWAYRGMLREWIAVSSLGSSLSDLFQFSFDSHCDGDCSQPPFTGQWTVHQDRKSV